ncbi:hypothetical protein P7K49_003745 [Saguinus oedipus]|uniref:Uncharacterized protein n=1 Tax=Saguinus oedipus TaxID=9490 RepID=A0ABQ9W732_SAGOE|nr:hypothetical protein P7K49_003745 [Saguinus oedipus]
MALGFLFGGPDGQSGRAATSLPINTADVHGLPYLNDLASMPSAPARTALKQPSGRKLAGSLREVTGVAISCKEPNPPSSVSLQAASENGWAPGKGELAGGTQPEPQS